MNTLGRLIVCCCLGGVPGCDATFVDQRRARPDSAANPDGARAPDGPSAIPDGPAPGADAPTSAGVFARGTFEGRAGHGGEGAAKLSRRADGTIELTFGSDFSVSGVAAPVVVLSSRANLGKAIDPRSGDLHLGALRSTRGEQSYSVSRGDGGRRWAWVYCEPFAVEIARAKLEDTP